MVNKLNAGFTGDVKQPANDLATRAKDVALTAREEAGALAVTAQDHPAATGAALALVAAVALGVGYVLGASSTPRRRYF